MRTRVLAILLALAAPCFAGTAGAQDVPGCGNLTNHYGPFDFRDPVMRRDRLPIVEWAHFTKDVESLRAGQSAPIIVDIVYTLRAFPNHPRALRSIARYALERGRFNMDAAITSAECAFERAIVYAPDDPAVRVIYGNYLLKNKERDAARKQYDAALALQPDSAEINYNAGLFFVDVGDLERAKQCAKIAYDKGYPLPGLSNRIAALESKGAKTRTQ
jgi:tetratricopeptide (TPR) repeat protein